MEINGPMKFNDKRIMKTGCRNPSRNKEEKYQLTSVLWLESNRMVSHFVSSSYFTQHLQLQKQPGNQFSLLNPSFKGWRP